MPRLRIVLLAALATLASGGLAAGLAWRWLAREILARRAGRSLPWRSVVQLRGDGLPDLLNGVRLLPVTWGGVLASVPLWPSAFPDWTPRGPWLGTAGLVFAPIVLVVMLGLILAHAYLGAPQLLRGDATTEPVLGAWRRPFLLHLAGAAVLAAPAIVTGIILMVSWPGLVWLRIAVVCVALAPAVGALVALPSMLDALGAELVPPPRWVPAPVPRWAAPAGFLTLAFAWGVVGARVASIAGGGSVFLPEASREWRDEQLARAERSTQIHSTIVGGAALDAAGLPCESEVVSWVALGRGAIAWCDQWTSSDGYQTVFFLTEGTDFADGRLPAVRSRTARGVVAEVAPIPGGVAAVELRPQPAEDATVSFDLVRIEPQREGLRRTARRALPQVRREAPTALVATGDRILVGWLGAKPDADRFLLFDDGLRPQLGSPWQRLAERFGRTWLLVLGLAALGTIAAVTMVARAGRLARVVRRRALRARHAAVRGAALFRGSLTPTGALALLRTEGGESVAVDPAGALRLGWPDDAELAGPCIVVGDRRAPRGGAYRGGLPEIRGGHPFAILKGDLAAATRLADEVRERLLRRALPLLWAVSVAPFAVVIASS